MPRKTILAIDNGTQSVRAILFDLNGEHRRQVAGPPRRLFFRLIPAGPSTTRKATGRRCARPARACGRSRASTRPACRAWPSPPSAARWSTSTRRASRCARRSPGWTSAPPPSCRRSAPGGARRSGWRGVTGTIDYLPQPGRDQLDPRRAARHLGQDRQVPAAVGLPELPPVRALRRFHRLAGGLCAVRLQGAPLGRQARLEMAGAGDQAVDAARTGGAGQP